MILLYKVDAVHSIAKRVLKFNLTSKEVVKFIKRIYPIRKVQFHGIDFIAIDGGPFEGTILKEAEDIKNDDR